MAVIAALRFVISRSLVRLPSLAPLNQIVTNNCYIFGTILAPIIYPRRQQKAATKNAVVCAVFDGVEKKALLLCIRGIFGIKPKRNKMIQNESECTEIIELESISNGYICLVDIWSSCRHP